MTRRSDHGLDVLDDSIDWRQRGACTKQDAPWFWPDEYRGTTAILVVQKAKAICVGCHVQQQCLQWALEHDQRFGIWGGLTAEERQQMREPT